MKVLFEEKIKVLVERNRWSRAYAQGYIDGENLRRRGSAPSKYAQIGIDEYSLGFRAGYYERATPSPTHSGRPDASVRLRRNASRS
jgi:hypothetical protein